MLYIRILKFFLLEMRSLARLYKDSIRLNDAIAAVGLVFAHCKTTSAIILVHLPVDMRKIIPQQEEKRNPYFWQIYLGVGKHYRLGECLRWLLTVVPERTCFLTRTVIGDLRRGLQVQAICLHPLSYPYRLGVNKQHY